MDRRVSLIFLAAVLGLSWESNNNPPPPSITLAALDVEVNETQDTLKNLYPVGPLVACTDDDPARAFIRSVSPSSPCGSRCFSLQPCSSSGGNSSEYCLFFVPGRGSLQYTQAPKYTLSIGCTDDVEPVTTQILTVTVIPNTPPNIIKPNPLNVRQPISGTNTNAGAMVFDVYADDIDNDARFYTMYTNPSTPYLSIGYANGNITATNDLKYFCQDSVQASVTVKDSHNNPAQGTVNIAFAINPSNKAPYATNLDRTVTVNENVGAGFVVLPLNIPDSTVYPKLNINMRSTSSAGMEQYMLDTSGAVPQLKTRINPNYERSETRSVKLYFDIDDGYCEANQTYSLTVNIVDINEQPQYTPDTVEYIEVYEENVNIDTHMYVSDPDINDAHTYSKAPGSDPLFNVDPNNGNIYSVSEIDIDTKTPFKQYTVITNVTDRGGLSSTATVKITVFDKNDQVPTFNTNAYIVAATECTDPGTVIGAVTGSDLDSYYNNNDQIYYGGGGGKMAVTSTGEIVLTQRCINGESFTGSATISDQGIYPGPLTGIPATLSMTCGPCPPPTPAPTPQPTTTSNPATTSSTPTNSTAAATKVTEPGYLEKVLPWLVPAIIGGLLWLALTAYLIYRYCCPCKTPCSGLCRRRPHRPETPPVPQTDRKPKKPATPKGISVIPLPVPPPPKALTPKVQPPPPPPPSPPKSDPYIFTFWEETYTDQDITEQPARSAKPKAVENMPPEDVVPRGNAPPPANLRLGNPGQGQHSDANARTNSAVTSTNYASIHPAATSTVYASIHSAATSTTNK